MKILSVITLALLLAGCSLEESSSPPQARVINSDPLSTIRIVETIVGFPSTGMILYVSEDSVRRNTCYIIADEVRVVTMSCTPLATIPDASVQNNK